MSLNPYPEYIDSGISGLGKIPADWQVAPLKTLVSHNDELLPENSSDNLAFHYVEISDVSLENGISLGDKIEFRNAPSRAKRIVRSGDVLVSTVRTYLRAIAGARSVPKDTVASTGFAVLRATGCDPRFLEYSLLTEFVIDDIIAHSVGVSYPAINASDLVRIKVPVPSDEEQIAIADYLDRETAEIDEFIADQEELITLLNERRAATITQAVTKGLDPSVPMKDSGVEWIGDVPGLWTVEKVSWLAKVGNGSTPASENPDYWLDGDVPWLNSSCVNLVEVVEPSKLVTETALRMCHLPMVPAGSLLVGLTGQGKTRGMATKLSISSTINQHLAYVTPSRRLNPNFAYWFLVAAYDHLRFISDGNGGTKGGLTCDQLGRVQLPMPSSSQQFAIAEYLDRETAEIDATIADAKEAIALSRERRAALISAAVTGKIDVRDAVSVKHHVLEGEPVGAA